MADIKNLYKDLENFISAVEDDLAEQIGIAVTNRAKASLLEPKSGVINKRTGRNRSVRGEAPASDSGDTSRNTIYTTKRIGGRSKVITIINNTEHAEIVEAENYLGRPYLSSAVETIMNDPIKIDKMLQDAVNRQSPRFKR